MPAVGVDVGGSAGIVGVVVVGHGRLAADMVETLESIVGPLEAVEGIATRPDETSEAILTRVARAIEHVDRGCGVVVLTDMLGDTASNVSVRLARGNRGIEVVTGVNMPMLVKLANCRRATTATNLAQLLRRYGQDHILWATRPEGPVA